MHLPKTFSKCQKHSVDGRAVTITVTVAKSKRETVAKSAALSDSFSVLHGKICSDASCEVKKSHFQGV